MMNRTMLTALALFAVIIPEAYAGTSVDANGNTTHTVKVGAMDQIQTAIGRGYLDAKCGDLRQACSTSQAKAVEDGVCLPSDSTEGCQAKMDLRSLPTATYKKTGVDFGICEQGDTRSQCNAKMEARAVARSRREKYKSINPADGDEKVFEFCMSSEVLDDGSIVYGSLPDDECFKHTVTAGLWPHPRSETIPRLNPAGKWAQFASRQNDGVFIGMARGRWAQEVADLSGTATGRDVDDLEEPPEVP